MLLTRPMRQPSGPPHRTPAPRGCRGGCLDQSGEPLPRGVVTTDGSLHGRWPKCHRGPRAELVLRWLPPGAPGCPADADTTFSGAVPENPHKHVFKDSDQHPLTSQESRKQGRERERGEGGAPQPPALSIDKLGLRKSASLCFVNGAEANSGARPHRLPRSAYGNKLRA